MGILLCEAVFSSLALRKKKKSTNISFETPQQIVYFSPLTKLHQKLSSVGIYSSLVSYKPGCFPSSSLNARSRKQLSINSPLLESKLMLSWFSQTELKHHVWKLLTDLLLNFACIYFHQNSFCMYKWCWGDTWEIFAKALKNTLAIRILR